MAPAFYDHRQIGWLTSGPVAVVVAFVTWRLAAAGLTVPAVAILSFVLLILALFGSLKVTVDQSTVRLAFGIGLIRRTVPIRTILGFRAVETRWYYGWGIRLTPRGWLWNVSGFEAVELDLAGGTHFLIGTDDPQGLVRALNRARS